MIVELMSLRAGRRAVKRGAPRRLHGTTKPQVTALRRTLTTCHANLAPGQPRLP